MSPSESARGEITSLDFEQILATFYRLHYRELLRVCRGRFLSIKDDVEDALQDVFTNIMIHYRNASQERSPRDDDEIRNLVYAAMRNKMIDTIRKRNTRNKLSDAVKTIQKALGTDESDSGPFDVRVERTAAVENLCRVVIRRFREDETSKVRERTALVFKMLLLDVSPAELSEIYSVDDPYTLIREVRRRFCEVLHQLGEEGDAQAAIIFKEMCQVSGPSRVRRARRDGQPGIGGESATTRRRQH